MPLRWRARADWFELKEFGPVTQRLAVTIENPSDAPISAALVHLPLADLPKTLPDAKDGQLCVVGDAPAKKPKREEANEWFVPFQISDNTLIFSLPLQPHEKKQIYLYTAPARLNLPGFPAGTAYDSRQAYRSFENRYAAFRMETGPGANPTGMAIDLWGKTKAGAGLHLVEAYQGEKYHLPSYWGEDILGVGKSAGLGGVSLLIGDQIARATGTTTFIDCLYQGPVETKLRVTAPIDVAGKKYNVTRYLTIIAEDRSLRDELIVAGDDLEDIRIGIGLRDLPNCIWHEHPDKGYAYQTGDANQPNYKAVGMGCTFYPGEFIKTIDTGALDKATPGHLYVLKGTLGSNALFSRHRLASIWDLDGQLPKSVSTAPELDETFESWFVNWSAERDNPIKIDIASQAETR